MSAQSGYSHKKKADFDTILRSLDSECKTQASMLSRLNKEVESMGSKVGHNNRIRLDSRRIEQENDSLLKEYRQAYVQQRGIVDDTQDIKRILHKKDLEIDELEKLLRLRLEKAGNLQAKCETMQLRDVAEKQHVSEYFYQLEADITSLTDEVKQTKESCEDLERRIYRGREELRTIGEELAPVEREFRHLDRISIEVTNERVRLEEALKSVRAENERQKGRNALNKVEVDTNMGLFKDLNNDFEQILLKLNQMEETHDKLLRENIRLKL